MQVKSKIRFIMAVMQKKNNIFNLIQSENTSICFLANNSMASSIPLNQPVSLA